MRCPWFVWLVMVVLSTFVDGHRAQAQEQEQEQEQVQTCLQIVSVEGGLNRHVGDRFEEHFAGKTPCFSVSYLSAARASQGLLSGTYDGELIRVADYPPFQDADVVMVPVPLVTGQGILVTRDPKVKTIEDLGSRELGLQRGIGWPAGIAKRHINKILLPNTEIMVDMFNKGRLDAFLIDNVNLHYHASDLVDAHQSIVLERSAYLWLAARHKALVPEISRALDGFSANGFTISSLENG